MKNEKWPMTNELPDVKFHWQGSIVSEYVCVQRGPACECSTKGLRVRRTRLVPANAPLLTQIRLLR
jgi:hypothetical protein